MNDDNAALEAERRDALAERLRERLANADGRIQLHARAFAVRGASA